MKQTHLFFPTPIVQDTIESDLEQYVMDLSRSDEGVKLSNKGGYQSKHFQKPEKEFQDLWEQIEGKLNEFHKDIAKLKGHVEINEWWFNVNHKGCMNKINLWGVYRNETFDIPFYQIILDQFWKFDINF